VHDVFFHFFSSELNRYIVVIISYCNIMAPRPPGMRSKLQVQKISTASGTKLDDVVPTSPSDPFVFQDQDTIVPAPPVVTEVVLAPHSPSKLLKLKQHKRSPTSGMKVEDRGAVPRLPKKRQHPLLLNYQPYQLPT
jgi:hypothetical protein